MEQETWIQNILESTNGITPVVPNEKLWAKIHTKIQQQTYVTPKTVWLVAASIAVLVVLNITVMKTKSQEKTTTPTSYFENTLNKSNQLYQ
jgi:archaellum biogenesis protein FlaJ (TadC family)